MAKTKKNIKKGKKVKNNNVKFNNTGLTEFVYKEGNQSPKKMTIKWDNDGNKTKINMNTNIDGKEKKTTLNLSNDKIKELLGATKVVDEPIDQRLINDFSIIMLPQKQQQQQIMLPLPVQQQQMLSPFNEQISFLTEEPIMRDIDLIPLSSIKSSSTSRKSSKKHRTKKGTKKQKQK
jgi:hypothetical protein